MFYLLFQPLIVEGSLASATAPTQELQYQIIKLISILTRYEEDWLSQHTKLVSLHTVILANITTKYR